MAYVNTHGEPCGEDRRPLDMATDPQVMKITLAGFNSRTMNACESALG
jgi:hypothetical protein